MGESEPQKMPSMLQNSRKLMSVMQRKETLKFLSVT
jgi:hypothetical protein